MQKVLVIGGAGFIGSHLVDVCLANSCSVSIYDNFSTGRREFLSESPLLRVIEGDILDRKSLTTAIGECAPDVLFHLAAVHHIPTCERIPDQALRINVEGTQNVLDACAQYDVPRVVFTSTGALYDPENTGPLSETSPVKPLDIYGISKYCAEQLVRYSVAKNESNAIVARLFNTVGRRETNAHVIPAIMAQLITGSSRVKLGNIHPKRDYIHTEDVAEALFELGSLRMNERFDIYNVGSGKEYSVREIIESCSTIIGRSIEAESSSVLARKIDRPSQLADITKLNRACGWAPSRSLAQALDEVWEESRCKSKELVEIS